MALKRNLIANYLGQAWVALMGLAFIPLYIKYLGIEAYGLIGLFAVLQAWLSLLDMGMTPTLGREMARFTGGSHSNESIRDLLRSIEIIAVAVAVLIACCITLGANWIATDWLRAETLSTEVVAQAFAIMGLVTALRFVEGVYRSTIVGLQRQVLSNVVNSLMATLRGFGAVGILIWLSSTIEAFFLWQGVVSIATLAILGITTYRCMPKGERSGRFSLDALRGVWRFAGGMMGIALLALLLTQVDKILLSKLLTLSEFGYYTLAGIVAGALYMLIGPITQAFYPKFCQLHAQDNTAGLATNYHQGAQLVSIVAGSAAIVLFFFAETLLRLWTQDTELAQRVAPLISVMVLGNLLNGLMWIPYHTQLAYGWTRLAIWTNVVAVTVLVPAILWTVPHYGAMGAAWIWVILNAGYCLISVQLMYRRILPQEKWRWYKWDVIAPLAASLLAAKTVQWLWPTWQGNMSDLALLALAAFATLSAALLAAGEIRQPFFNLLKTRFMRRAIAHGHK
jgi:O-antigen/teichoic acid export membrane protein